MSQKKVDKYKETKAKRQQLMKREKMIRRLEFTAMFVVLVAMFGWFGWSVYSKVQESAPAKTYVMDTTAIDDYMATLSADETAEDATEEDADGEDAAAEDVTAEDTAADETPATDTPAEDAPAETQE